MIKGSVFYRVVDIKLGMMSHPFLELVAKIRKYSKKLNDSSLIIDQHWILLKELTHSKTVYLFRSNNQLLIVKDGIVQKNRWEFISNSSILIETDTSTSLYKHSFLDEKVLVLNLDGTNELLIYINESKVGRELNSLKDVIAYLNDRYLKNVEKKSVTRISENPIKVWQSYQYDEGILEIEIYKSRNCPQSGDLVRISNQQAPDGYYKLKSFSPIFVRNGQIESISFF